MTDNKNTVAVIGDLTALYSARSQHRKQINYEHLDEVLKGALGTDKLDLSVWFTLFSGQNEGQVSFVQGLKDMGWNIDTMDPRELRRGSRPTDYRFNTQIAYQLGLAVGEHNKLLVVSDSFDLLAPLQELHADDPEMEVNLAFFSEAIDGRWWRTLNDDNGFIRFVDLDAELYD